LLSASSVITILYIMDGYSSVWLVSSGGARGRLESIAPHSEYASPQSEGEKNIFSEIF